MSERDEAGLPSDAVRATGPAATAPSNWNLPNALTTLRIVMVPFYGWALLADGGDSVLWRTVAFVLFTAAMVTDKVDGDIARARNLVTDFGKIADPIADKAITGMAFIGLSIIIDTWWMWTITVVVLLREWAVTLLRLSVLKSVVIAAAQSGKWKTVAQALALGLLSLPLLEVDGWLDTPGEVVFGVALLVLAVAFVLTIWSGYEFFRDVWRQRHDLRTSRA
jgi:CDP-diacylglycerol--glycerol-3-phosphate 3-phosphatidyltransferase